MSLPSSNWFSHWAVRVFANAPQPGKIQTRRRRTMRPAQQISLESLEPRQMLSVNYQMVSVGDPGNAPDTSPVGYGAVSYDYQIGKYDVTVGQYTEFLNAKAQADPYGLYNASMGTDRISRSGTSGSYTYAVMSRTGNRPVTYVSWFDSARFSNWMSNGQGSTSTETGGYTLINGQTTGNAPAGNAGAGFRIPTENEWYKAAYFSPDYRDSGEDGYYNYATQSDTLPGTGIRSGENQANYNNVIGRTVDVGSFSGSGSFYGTFDQTGNVYQWNDLDGTPSYSRGWRGGSWDTVDFGGLSSSGNRTTQNILNGSNEDGSTGFRLVTRPTVPGSPTSVGVAINSNGQPVVTWSAPVTNGGSAITDYVVKYTRNAGTSWTRFRPSLPITTTSCTVTGLAIGTPYIFKVISRNAVGIGQRSVNSAPATPTLLVPGSPTSVVAVSVAISGSGQIAVTWLAPANTGGSVITDYVVKYSSNGGSTWTNFVHPASTATSYTVTGLTNGTFYVIKVIAKNAVGSGLPSANSALLAPAFMSMVTVGNPGNAADTGSDISGYGAVSYTYQIGTYDVTGSQYTAFLNAVGSTDTYELYNTRMGSNNTKVAQISRSGTAGTYTYAVMNSTGNRPVLDVSWFDCARFSNWMSNGQPSGAQVSATTENGAYNLNGVVWNSAVAPNATNPNTGLAPTYRIPLENEWYKAAYYSPNYGGSGIGGYYAFATQSNSAPGTTLGSSANQANYNNAIGTATDVGAFSGSGSFYGTFDQTGNVFQWNDLDGTTGSSRGLRGGYWSYDSNTVSSSARLYNVPSYEDLSIGFRLASPVTTTLTLCSDFNYVVGNGQVTITGYKGDARAITIPSSIGGLPVTSIGADAFSYSHITSVVIPEGVTTLGQGAFYACTSLTQVSIPASTTSIGYVAFVGCDRLAAINVVSTNSAYTTVGGALFSKDMLTLIQCPAGATTALIPAGVRTLGANAFFGCKNIISVYLPESVAIIEHSAFAACPNLTVFTVNSNNQNFSGSGPALLNKLGTILVAWPSAVSVTIPSSIAEIGEAAFYGNSNLWSVVLPSGLQRIGSGAFVGCTQLTTLTLPSTLQSVASNAFYYATGLKSLYFMGNAPTAGTFVFTGVPSAKAYYLSGTTGWSSSWAGISTVVCGTQNAPTNVIGTPGRSQVSLNWTAPSSNGGTAITDYTIQYSSNGGTNWTTFTHSASTATFATVTGLTNGIGYVLRVAAVNSAGTGSWSLTLTDLPP